MAATKIATCCYCGTKAALVLRGKDRHELTCSNCGAPLRSLKMLPLAQSRAASRPVDPKPVKSKVKRSPPRPAKRRKGKSLGSRILSELWDVIEDVVDEVFD